MCIHASKIQAVRPGTVPDSLDKQMPWKLSLYEVGTTENWVFASGHGFLAVRLPQGLRNPYCWLSL